MSSLEQLWLRWLSSGRVAVAITLAMTTAGQSADVVYPELPVVNCTVVCYRPFDPRNPTVTVVYSNASTNATVSVEIPADSGERRLLGPGADFDGERGDLAHRDYDERYGDLIPTVYEIVPAGRAFSVNYSLGDRFNIPLGWSKLGVRPVHQYQYAEHSFEFDRSGNLVRTELLRQRDIARVRAGRDRVLEGRARWDAMRRTGTPHRVRSNTIGTNVGVSVAVAPAVKSGPSEDRASRKSRSDRVGPQTVHFSGRVFVVVLLGVIAVGALVSAFRRRHGGNPRTMGT